jgi:hypothetical protein
MLAILVPAQQGLDSKSVTKVMQSGTSSVTLLGNTNALEQALKGVVRLII